MKKWVLILLVGLFVLISLAAFYLNRNPLRFINRFYYPLSMIRQENRIVDHNGELRHYQTITFQRAEADTFCVTISKPSEEDLFPKPVIVLLGGLEIGRRSLNYIPRHGQNIIVAYEYPYRPHYWYDGTALEEIPKIRRSVLIVPAQISQLVEWIKKQSWADTTRISLLGYSFGALAIPSALKVMNLRQTGVDGVIMAYGGVNLYEIFKVNLKTIPAFFRPMVSRLIAWLIRPVEPGLYLPFLKGDFLLINGRYDRQIPESSWRALHRLTPQPKEIVLLDAGHLHPKKKELIQNVVRISYDWLSRKKLISPLPVR
ncbi:alpha/beta hydrolase family protein [Calditrichota bacterium LG25]